MKKYVMGQTNLLNSYLWYLDLIFLDRSYFSVLIHKTPFLFFLLIETNLVNFPFYNVEFFVMISYSYPFLNRILIVRNFFSFAPVAIRKVWPTIFWCIWFIVYNKIVTKTRSIIAMHPYRKLFLERFKLQIFKLPSQRKEKGFVWRILLILPAFRRTPWNSTESTH